LYELKHKERIKKNYFFLFGPDLKFNKSQIND